MAGWIHVRGAPFWLERLNFTKDARNCLCEKRSDAAIHGLRPLLSLDVNTGLLRFARNDGSFRNLCEFSLVE